MSRRRAPVFQVHKHGALGKTGLKKAKLALHKQRLAKGRADYTIQNAAQEQVNENTVQPITQGGNFEPIETVQSSAASAQEQLQPQEQQQDQQSQEQQSQEQQSQEQEEQQSQEQEEQQSQEQEELPQLAPGSEVRFPLVSSHLHNGRLHTAAVCMTPYGPSVVHARTACNSNFGIETVLQKHRNIVLSKGLAEKQKQYSKELVDRARQGDQNAMAIITLVRDNANKGIPRAKQSFDMMKNYIDANPVKPSPFGYSPESEHIGDSGYRPDFGSDWSTVMIANGPRLNNRNLARVASTFGNEEDVSTFMKGMKLWRDNHEKEHKQLIAQLDDYSRKVLEIGKILGRARALQFLRMPNTPIKPFSEKVAWELGE